MGCGEGALPAPQKIFGVSGDDFPFFFAVEFTDLSFGAVSNFR